MKRKLIVLSVVISMVLSLIPLNTAAVTFAADREETGEADVNARPGSDIYADIIESIDPQADAFWGKTVKTGDRGTG